MKAKEWNASWGLGFAVAAFEASLRRVDVEWTTRQDKITHYDWMRLDYDFISRPALMELEEFDLVCVLDAMRGDAPWLLPDDIDLAQYTDGLTDGDAKLAPVLARANRRAAARLRRRLREAEKEERTRRRWSGSLGPQAQSPCFVRLPKDQLSLTLSRIIILDMLLQTNKPIYAILLVKLRTQRIEK